MSFDSFCHIAFGCYYSAILYTPDDAGSLKEDKEDISYAIEISRYPYSKKLNKSRGVKECLKCMLELPIMIGIRY